MPVRVRPTAFFYGNAEQIVNAFFLKSHTFLAKEVEAALTRAPGIELTVLKVPVHSDEKTVDEIIERVRQGSAALVVTLNDAGYDNYGKLSTLLDGAGVYRVNWYHDNPFYEYIYGVRTFPSCKRRIDFVTEATFVSRMKRMGFCAHFLPLATDLNFFNTWGEVEYSRDIAFVGNSSLEFIDTLITEEMENALSAHRELVNELHTCYRQNPRTDIRELLLRNESVWRPHIRIDPEKFMFVVEWLVGYFYRRDVVKTLAQRFGPSFMCFGDIYWQRFIDSSQVSTDACYYTNLCKCYRGTRVNVNINRIQITTSFTQRIFDCKASAAFILTERRALNHKFFITQGPNREIVEFDTPSQCVEYCDYYRTHDQERERIALNGVEKVKKYHTYDVRIAQMLEVCKKTWGI